MKKKILLIIGVIIIGLIVLAVIGGSGTKKSSQLTTTTTDSKVTQIPERISVRDLADDFDTNQVAAEVKWKDKLVEFSAEISNITDTGISFSRIATKQFSLTQISCRIQDKQQLLSLKNDQTVTVRGVVGTQNIGVIDLSKCEVVDK